MKISSLLLILFASIFFVACEEEVKNPNLLYEQKLVVSAFLFPNETLKGISVSMTHPPLEDLYLVQDKDLFIKNANVTITTQGKSYVCSFNENDYSYYCNDLYLLEGKTYHLVVKYKNMTATATTIIPTFNVDSIYYKINEKKEGIYTYYTGYIYAKINSTYPMGYYTQHLEEYGNYYTIRETMAHYNPKSNSNTDLFLKIYSTYSINSLLSDINNWSDTIFVCDEQMYRYYVTKNDSDNWNLFAENGTNPVWNIKGDGIGLFIGYNKKAVRCSK